jgi:flagellar basal-body rod protein FlgF
MERLVHIASNSMRINAENQRLIAAGLANQNTIAFKRDYGSPSSAYFGGEGGMDRVFPTRGENSVDLEVGKIIPTENPLDVSIEGAGFFTAQKQNGDNVLTRRGDLKIGADRILRNGEGLALLGDAGPITIPNYEKIEISRDGSVLIRAPGTEANAAATPVGRLTMVNVPPSNVEKGIDSLLRTRDRSVPQADANITLNPKGLEASNISPIDSMVEMLSSSRSFELSVKLLSTAKELDDQTAKLMRTDR